MIGKLQRVLLKRPDQAFIDQQNLEAQWQAFNYSSCPDYREVLREYDDFETIIKAHVPDVHYLPHHEAAGLDSIYTHDPVKISSSGAILMNMGKAQREPEPRILKEYLEELGIPVLGEIGGKGRMEGGDILWLDEQTAAIASGYRTNREGIRQFIRLTEGFLDEIIEVPLPHADGPSACLHLMSIISLVDTHLAAVYSRYMPVFFRELLLDRGIHLIEVDDSEYKTLGCNILALEPGKCLLPAGNPKIKRQLETEGIHVYEYPGRELSLKGTGGPTCLTCPVLRE
jgi:N-dimethylarginine dimethylaminohydrolase